MIDIYMGQISHWLNELLVNRFDIKAEIAGALSTLLLTAAMIAVGLFINWILQAALRWISKDNSRLARSKGHPFIVRRKLGHHILLIIPGIILYMLPYLVFDSEKVIRILHRADLIYIIIVLMRIANALLLSFLDFYRTTDKNRQHPLQGMVQGLQVLIYFVGGIIIPAILIDKSPAVLLTGLGASAAVLMLIFKDSILGFVAGVQLSQNNMVRIGDWIQMPDGSANGNVEEITLNTVKVRGWDNTISNVSPYTLTSGTFKNWHGMFASGGRRIARSVEIDINTVKFCPADLIERIGKLELAPVGVIDTPVSLWYRVQDESLAPRYEIGDLIALWAYPKGEEDPIPGKLYGINTLTNGLIIRKLFPAEDGYIARAVNKEDFPDYKVKATNVVQVYKIMLMVRF